MVPSVGGGMHGGLNRYELNTVLMMNTPGVLAGDVRDLPSRLIDIAPTILGLPGDGLAGRNLAAETMGQAIRTVTHQSAWQGFRQAIDLAETCDRQYVLQGDRHEAPEP